MIRIPIVGSVVLAARVLLAGVFVVAAVGKLLDLAGSRSALVSFGVPPGVAPIAGTLLPLVELLVAGTLLVRTTTAVGAVAAMVLLLAFVAGIAAALRNDRSPECHCFGKLHSAPAGWETLARNGALTAVAALILLAGPGPSLPGWLNHHGAASVIAVAGVLASVALAVSSLSLHADKRRLSAQLSDVVARAQKAPAGLAVGAPAPSFLLTDAHGKHVSLEALRGREVPVALVFVEPTCEPCQSVLAELGRWQASLAPVVTIAAVTRGGLAPNLALANQHGLAPVLIQEDSEVIDAYRVPGTPAAVIINPDATIARPLAVGPRAIEALIRVTIAAPDPRAQAPEPVVAV